MKKNFKVMGLRYIGDIELDIDEVAHDRFNEIWRYDYCRSEGTMWTIFNHKGERYIEDKLKSTLKEYCQDLVDGRFEELYIYGYLRDKQLPIKIASAKCINRVHI